jgi:DNA invertase Pin-like site-specific DNA recombinase
MRQAYSYIRFSTKTQELGNSLERQLKRTKEYCTANDFELSNTSFQDLGISAFQDKTRASLDDMLTAVKSGSIASGSVIILESLDRLSRRGIDHTQVIVKSILRHGVEIVSLQDGLHLEKDSVNDLVSVIRLALSADLAHQESVKKSERVKAAKEKQKSEAREGKVINKRLVSWISLVNGKYVLNDKADIVRKVITLRQAGAGYHKIAIMMNESGYTSRYGGSFSDTTIREMIKNHALYGAYQIGRVEGNRFVAEDLIKDYFPALVSYSEFKELQAEYIKRTGGHAKHNHLSGTVRCGHCSGAIQKKVTKRKTQKRVIEYKQWLCGSSLNGACEFKNGIRDLDLHIFKVINCLIVDKPKAVSKAFDFYLLEVDRLKKLIDFQTKKLAEVNEKVFDLVLGALDTSRDKLKVAEQALEELSLVSNEVSTKDVELLGALKGDVEAFNLQLKKLVSSIVVTKKAKNMWHIKISQRNGHFFNITVFRQNERSEFKYFISGTDFDLFAKAGKVKLEGKILTLDDTREFYEIE